LARESPLEVICKVHGRTVAEVIKAHLESEGIPAMLTYESAGLIYGINVDGMGEVRILVPSEFAEEARRIIQPLEPPTSSGD
jgi:hypothetical protein